jgi:ribonuclease P protein subunit POP4
MREILKDEIIGLDAEVIEAANKDNLGLKGRIVDETKNTITLLTPTGEKKLVKNDVSIIVEIEGKKIKIECAKLASRPEERIKKSR